VPTGDIKAIPGEALAWEAITQWITELRTASARTGVAVSRLAGHVVIESGGNPRAIQKNNTNGWSYGLMQIVPYAVGWEGHHQLVAQIGGCPDQQRDVIAALYDPGINLLVGASLLGGFHADWVGESWDMSSSRFFLGNPNWKGADTVNGNTGDWYRITLGLLIKEWEAAQGTTPAPEPEPPQPEKPRLDPISAIVGGIGYTVTFDFGEGNYDEQGRPLDYYGYGIGHGVPGNAANRHAGVDVGIADETPLYTPIPGRVECVGALGTPRWGQACGAYNDYTGGSPQHTGNITIYDEASGVKLTLGHCSAALVGVGDRVQAGQKVGLSGGMNGPHVHVETSIYAPERVDRSIEWYGGDYWILEPRKALAEAMGGEATAPPIFADTLPVPQPKSLDTFATVTVTAERVPVLQYGDLEAPRVKPDIEQGDTFDAAQAILGDDGNWYWIGRYAGRVPIAGTIASVPFP
jgi:murein DD-endopeptidase MepM/ murein hydrolase activator NlpD